MEKNTEYNYRNLFVAFLLVTFIIPSVSATFANYTAERAYNYLSAVSADTPDFDSGSEFDAENYTAANSSDNIYAELEGGSYMLAQQSFHFNLSGLNLATVDNLTVFWEGYRFVTGVGSFVDIQNDTGFYKFGTLATSDSVSQFGVDSGIAGWLDENSTLKIRAYINYTSAATLKMYTDVAYVEVNYSTSTACSPAADVNWVISSDTFCNDGNELNLGLGNLTILPGGILTLTQGTNLTASYLELQRTGEAVIVDKGSELIIKGSK